MAPSTFGVRFGFAVWLHHLVHGRAPSFRAIGLAVGRTGEAVSAWTRAEQPPNDFRVHEPLAAYLEVPEGWLMREKGDPPRPELWEAWAKARRQAPKQLGAASLLPKARGGKRAARKSG